MKIADLVVNNSVVIALAIKSVKAAKTRPPKNNPYLDFVLTDGVDTISAKYWDWTGAQIPPTDQVYDFAATVGEWQGNKQLTITAIRANTTMTIADFAPKSDYDLDLVYHEMHQMASNVTNAFLSVLALGILDELKQLWLTAPAANSIHHAFIGGTLVHSYTTAKKAKAIAEVTEGANVDLVTVGAMLHDVGKLYGYTVNGAAIEMTDEGMLQEHLYMGAHFVDNFAEEHHMVADDTDNMLLMLRHIILSHHGELEYGAVVTPASIEAVIVSMCDNIDASCEAIREAARKHPNEMWTERVWSMHNRPVLNPIWVSEALDG